MLENVNVAESWHFSAHCEMPFKKKKRKSSFICSKQLKLLIMAQTIYLLVPGRLWLSIALVTQLFSLLDLEETREWWWHKQPHRGVSEAGFSWARMARRAVTIVEMNWVFKWSKVTTEYNTSVLRVHWDFFFTPTKKINVCFFFTVISFYYVEVSK